MTQLKVVESAGISKRVSEVEWKTRVDLAACYRLMAMYGMSDMIYNHITARIPDTQNELLINPYGMLYDEITASSLVKIDIGGNILLPNPEYGINPAGYVIHSAVHEARHDVQCVIHTHSRAGMAVSAMRCGLLPLAQTSMRFYNCTSYHAFEGPALNLDERRRLVSDLGRNDTLILRNHGLLVCGRTIPDAFNRMYFLENACKLQVDAIAAGVDLSLSSSEVAQLTADILSPERSATNSIHNASPMDGQLEWCALRRKLDRTDPGYAD